MALGGLEMGRPKGSPNRKKIGSGLTRMKTVKRDSSGKVTEESEEVQPVDLYDDGELETTGPVQVRYTASGSREGVTRIYVEVDDRLRDFMSDYASKRGLSRADVMRQALVNWADSKGYQG